MPIGFIITVVFFFACTAFALAPAPPNHSRPVSVAFWFAFIVNEIPVLAIEFLVVSTLLALFSGDIGNPGGIFGAAVALVAISGLVTLSVRACTSANKLRGDVEPDIGPVQGERHPIRALQWPFPTHQRGVVRVRNISYGDGPRHRLDVYHSRDGGEAGPMFVYFHGGRFRSGDKGRQARPLLQSLAARGWVCLSANYPLVPRATYPDQLGAARMALSWARREGPRYGGDPDKVLLAGSSAGAHLAAMVALTDPTTCGAVCLGGYYGSADGVDTDASPSAHLTSAAPPFLVIHGDHDTIVVVNDAREFVDRLRAASSNPVVYAELAGAQHSFDIYRSPRMEAIIDTVDAFGAVSCRR